MEVFWFIIIIILLIDVIVQVGFLGAYIELGNINTKKDFIKWLIPFKPLIDYYNKLK